MTELRKALSEADRVWFHKAHGLHDEKHHQAHRPMDLCVPLIMVTNALRAALSSGVASPEPEREPSGPCIECGYHRNIESENSVARGLRLARHNAHAALPRGVASQPELDVAIRRFLWLNHGHGESLYGDDGEMQCHACPQWDYRRAPIEAVLDAANLALHPEYAALAETLRSPDATE